MESFTRLFETTLSRAPYKGDSADKRNKGLKNTLQDQVYQYVTRSLFKADRLAFAIHLGKIIIFFWILLKLLKSRTDQIVLNSSACVVAGLVT